MGFKVSQFTKTVLKTGEPYNLTVLCNKPTALELIQIQSQSQQVYANFKTSTEEGASNSTEALAEMFRYQIDILGNYVTCIEGLEGDDGNPVAVSNTAEVRELISRFPVDLIGLLFGKFLEALYPSATEKKS
jgi:hypothetical protein